MKYKFIPVNNDLNKAIAFANSLDPNFTKQTQRIKIKPNYIPTLNIITSLQNEGWQLKGVSEHKNRQTKKTKSHYLQLQHPDFNIKTNNKLDSLASITLSNSCDGSSPIKMDMGVFRLVCSNGLITKKTAFSTKIKHNRVDINRIPQILNNFTNKTNILLDSFNKLKYKQLSKNEIMDLAYQSVKLKYKEPTQQQINDIILVNRDEDKGNNMWGVFNRIQENLTNGIMNIDQDIQLNKQLYSLVEKYV